MNPGYCCRFQFSALPALFCFPFETMKWLDGSDQMWWEGKKSTFSYSRNKVQDSRRPWEASFFITIFQILILVWVAWGHWRGQGREGGDSSLFYSLWPFSRFIVMLIYYTNCLDVIPQLPCATLQFLMKNQEKTTEFSESNSERKSTWAYFAWTSELQVLFQNLQSPWMCLLMSHGPEIPKVTLRLLWTRSKITWKPSSSHPINWNSAQGSYTSWFACLFFNVI